MKCYGEGRRERGNAWKRKKEEGMEWLGREGLKEVDEEWRELGMVKL